MLKLSLGAVVAADVKLTGGEVLLDQSMLTGASVPIEADLGVQTYAGALVRRGAARRRRRSRRPARAPKSAAPLNSFVLPTS